MAKIKVGIIGCGAMGGEIARYIDTQIPGMELVAICDTVAQKTGELANNLVKRPAIFDVDRLIDASDLVVESASKNIVKEVLQKCLQKLKNVLIMSTGGILENLTLLDLVRKKGIRLYLPSGAITGLDGLKAARIGEIQSVVLTTRKPPASLKGAPFITQNKIDIENIKEETLLFEGSASEAVDMFPFNINVAATLSLAGIGAKRTRVRIFASPNTQVNIHEIEVTGEFGKFIARTENMPSSKNPKTSYLAILSAMATLKEIADTVKIGT